MESFKIAEHKIFQVDGHDFLFLSRDKAIFELDTPTTTILKLWSRKEALSEESVIEDLTGTKEEKIEWLKNLARMRILVPLDMNDSAGKGLIPEFGEIPLKHLILHVTEACNLRCDYCYYGESHGRRKRNHSGTMSLETAKTAVDFLIAHSKNLKEVGIVFFGGEPLLNFKLITEIVPYATECGRRVDKKVTFSLTTNATLLNDDIVAYLANHHIGVTVSMDGHEDIHDRHRRFPDGSPSYEIIYPKILHLIRALHKPVPARVTLVKTAGDLSVTLRHLLEMGFAEVGFSPVTTGNRKFQFSKSAMDELLSQFRLLSCEFLSYACRDEYLGFSNLTDLLVSLHGNELKNYPCGAGLGLFSVSHEGRLFLCQRFTGQDPYCMGDIFNGFNREKLQAFREQAEISRKKECRRCWVRTLCTGGCYHEACVREGDWLKPNLHYCNWIQKWIETGLEIYGRLSISCPDYLDKLAWMRGQDITC
jgi:uncharacterized protein